MTNLKLLGAVVIAASTLSCSCALAQAPAGPGMYGYGNQYGWRGDWNDFPPSNNIGCRPGTYFRGADGFRHPCQ